MEEFPRLLECKEMAGKVAQIAAGKGNNTPYQHTISIHPINTQYQYTLSIHPISTPYQHTLSTHTHPKFTLILTLSAPYRHHPLTPLLRRHFSGVDNRGTAVSMGAPLRWIDVLSLWTHPLNTSTTSYRTTSKHPLNTTNTPPSYP